MSDSSIRRSGSRTARGSSRTPSARSSAYIPDDRSQQLPAPQHSLRAVDSRFSLHEQFAATRREYEFGDDDSSSVLERITTPSELGQDVVDQEKTLTAGFDFVGAPGSTRLIRHSRRDYYELFCILRDESLRPDAIRKAYYRLFYLLHAVEPPASLRSLAEVQFQHVQEAFETLIEPYRRIDYDIAHSADDTSDSESACPEGDAENETTASPRYDEALQDRYLQYYQERTGASGELAVRLDATRLFGRNAASPARRSWRILSPLDVTVCQSTTVELPALKRALDPVLQQLQDMLPSSEPQKDESSQRRLHCGYSTLTIGGSIQAFRKTALLMAPALVFDNYRPPGAIIQGRTLLSRLLSAPFLPQVDVKLRQELCWSGEKELASGSSVPEPENARRPDVVLEVETDFSPQPTVITRLGGSVTYPGVGPFHAEVSTRAGPTPIGPTASIGLALHRRMGNGTAFVALDGGDWPLQRNETCRQYSVFSQLNRSFNQAKLFLLPPTAEVGYTVSSHELGLQAGRAFTKTADRGIRGLDRDLEDDIHGSWTVSAAVTRSNAAGYLRYGRDLFSRVTGTHQAARLPRGNYSHASSGIRAEVEFSTSKALDHVVAVRGLKRLGRFSRVGLELGLTPYTLHLSVYWSRLGQRISLPLLVAGSPNLDGALVFWTAVASFCSFAALEAFIWRPASRAKRRRYEDLTSDQLQELISSRRNEADELTALLAGAVEHRQRHEKEKGGLVVTSAKYGVKDTASPSGWGMDEVADVTIAVSALVDDGMIYIPRGLRKSRLLGFWDPAPMRTKVLRVTYTIGGQQQTLEVRGREELRLP